MSSENCTVRFTAHLRENVGGSEKSRVCVVTGGCLSAFTADASSQLDVLGYDRHSLGVDGKQVSVFEQTDQV